MKLQVFTSRHCLTCADAIAAASACAAELPHVDVEIVDVDTEPDRVPDGVIAVPTFVLDGRVIHLGTPAPEWLRDRLAQGRKGPTHEPHDLVESQGAFDV
jgi:alkyl hydroperoxide reductase subunit AhpF